jgi:translation initiation factor IF-1
LPVLPGFRFLYSLNKSLQPKKNTEEGEVVEALPDTKFRVKLRDGKEVFAYLSGKMRLHYIKVMIGDIVTIELSDDRSRGRIVFRK